MVVFNTIIIMIIVCFAVLVGGGALIFLMYKSGFKNTAWIARQTGPSPDDVVWIPDKFRVRNDNNMWIIEFLHMRERSPSFEGKFWSKFLAPAVQKKLLKYTKEQFDVLELRKHIRRGIFFYESAEGEFFPMQVGAFVDENGNKVKEFKVLTQDIRQFVIQETQRIVMKTTNPNKWNTSIIAVVIVFGILAISFFGAMYWMNENNKASLQANAQVCSSYTEGLIRALNNASNNGQKPVYSGPNIGVPGTGIGVGG